MKKVLILGAGPVGLGAAHFLESAGHKDYCVLEQRSFPGGLSASYKDGKGFTWDFGGHVCFSHYKYFDEVLSSLYTDEGMNEIQRNARVYYKGRFHKYPFQYNLNKLPKEEALAVLNDFKEKRDDNNNGDDFASWIKKTFGPAFSEIFMLPYNEKVWAYPPSMLASGWIAERVAEPDYEKAKASLEDEGTEGWGPNSSFLFPKHGGTGDIFMRIAAKTETGKLLFNEEAEAIEGKSVLSKSGKRYEYDYLISSLPINRLTNMISGFSPQLKSSTDELLYSSVHVFGFGLRAAIPKDMAPFSWIYFPEGDAPHYRMTVFSNYSKANVPGNGYYSLMCEISESRYKKVNKTEALEQLRAYLVRKRFIKRPGDIVSVWHRREEYGYPTPSLKRDEIIEKVNAELEGMNILSRGRFGAWKYEVGNMDHSFMQGAEAAARVLYGIEEKTCKNPSFVNGGALKESCGELK